MTILKAPRFQDLLARVGSHLELDRCVVSAALPPHTAVSLNTGTLHFSFAAAPHPA
jgi:hypothetical protein